MAGCPGCKSQSVRKDGFYRYKDRVLQSFECKACGRKFNEKSGSAFHRLRYPAFVVTLALLLQVQMMLSGSQTRLVLMTAFPRLVRFPHPRTLQRWVRRFSPHLVSLQRRLKPRFGRVWSMDELFANRHAHKSKRRPCPKFLYTILDEFRQVVACLVTSKRDAGSVERALKIALERAGFVPDVMSTDACGIYTKAKRRLQTRMKGTRWVQAHFQKVAIPVRTRERVLTRRGPRTRTRKSVISVSQNGIERYHCGARTRENNMRGVKTDESGTSYFEAYNVAHNLFRPHERHDGKTPAEAAGWAPPGLTWNQLPALV